MAARDTLQNVQQVEKRQRDQDHSHRIGFQVPDSLFDTIQQPHRRHGGRHDDRNRRDGMRAGERRIQWCW